MATKKKLLQAAAGTAAAGGGAGGLNVESVFSTYLYEGNGGSQVIENGINLGQSFGSGSAEFDGTGNYVTASSGYLSSVGTGDFTIEGWWYFKDFTARTYFARCWSFGTGLSDGLTLNVNTSGTLQLRLDDALQITASTAITTNTWYHIALCRNSGTTTLYIDGFSRGSFSDSNNYSTLANNSFYVGAESNGSGGYTNSYVSNIRIVNGSAVYTANFNPSTSALADISGTSLLTLQGDDPFVDNSSSPLTITKVSNPKASAFGPFDAADAGEGGLVWIKDRTSGNGHNFYDTERGATKRLASNLTSAETTRTNGVTSFNANGFSGGNDASINTNGNDYASWTFRKAPKFFDVVTATAPSSGTLQVSHNLGTTVGCIILKSTSDTDNWVVYHRGMGANYYATMNQTNPWVNVTGVFDGVTDTYFTLDPSKNCTAGRTYVAYVFAHNDGDADFGPTGDQDVISCGSFTSDSNGDISVELGWEPQFVLYRRTDQGGVWIMTDTMRGMSVDGGTNINYLAANSSNTEQNNATGVYPTPTGIGGNFNALANTPAIYIAIRRGPMAVPTDATDVFAIDQGINSSVGDRVFNAGFPVDLMIRTDPTTTYNRVTLDRLRGNGAYVITNGTDAETDTAYGGEFDDMEGVFTDTSFDFSNHYAYMWKRAPKYFDAVAYTGNGTAGRTVSHNLGVAPEMMIVKNRSSANWQVYHKDLNGGVNPASYWLSLNQTSAEELRLNKWNNTEPTDQEFTLGDGGTANTSGDNYIAYLFASLDGVSKVGSYTGTGAAQNIDCGFSSGARFVLIKRTDSSGYGWMVCDTERGIVSGNDPRLQLNTTDAEVSNADVIDPYSGGFALTSTGTSFNASGGSYIFYAVA